MPTQYDDVDAICPFFCRGGERRIVCEGITDRCSTELVFLDTASRDVQRQTFCNKKFENCEIYRMLEAKYE